MFSSAARSVAVVVAGDQEVGVVPPDRGGQVAPQREAVLDEAVGMVEEFHDVDPDDPRHGPLLRLTERSGLGGGEAVDAFSPRVTRRYMTALPSAVQQATAPDPPYSRSSGWATMASARNQS